jgi:tetratricopeptide (TPR) repeat protein
MNKSFWVKCFFVFFTLTASTEFRVEAQIHNADYYYERSHWKMYQRNYAGAIEDLNTAIKLRPNDSQNYNARGLVYEKCGNYEAAMADFEYALRLNPYSAETQHNIGNLNNKLNGAGRYSSNINYTNEYSRSPSGNITNVQVPVRTVSQPLVNTPVNGEAWRQDYRQTNAAAVQAPVYSVSTRPQENTPVNYKNVPVFKSPVKKIFIDPIAEKYNILGAELNENGRFDEAIEQFNAAIKIYPNYAIAYNNRGVAFAGKGDLKRAAEDFNQALRINPYYHDAQFNRERVNNGKAGI